MDYSFNKYCAIAAFPNAILSQIEDPSSPQETEKFMEKLSHCRPNV